MEELWKRHSCGVEVSNFGRVRDSDGGLVSQRMEADGSKYVVLNKRYYVHNLVVDAFIEVSDGKPIKHLDGDNTNNFVDNLKITDSTEVVDASVHNQAIRAYSENGELLCVFGSTALVQRIVGVGAGAVSRCCRRQYGDRATVRDVIWRFASDDEFYKQGMEPTSNAYDMMYLCGTYKSKKLRDSLCVTLYSVATGVMLFSSKSIAGACIMCHCSLNELLEYCIGRKWWDIRGFVPRLTHANDLHGLGPEGRLELFKEPRKVGYYL